jgi:hypothetical protein
VSPKRGERVASPPGPGEWEIRFATSEAAKGWEELCNQVPGNTREAWLVLRTEPGPRPPTGRHHQLKYDLATRVLKGIELTHWQFEVTGGGRIWYLLDIAHRTVWIDHAGTGHPRATDR